MSKHKRHVKFKICYFSAFGHTTKSFFFVASLAVFPLFFRSRVRVWVSCVQIPGTSSLVSVWSGRAGVKLCEILAVFQVWTCNSRFPSAVVPKFFPCVRLYVVDEPCSVGTCLYGSMLPDP